MASRTIRDMTSNVRELAVRETAEELFPPLQEPKDSHLAAVYDSEDMYLDSVRHFFASGRSDGVSCVLITDNPEDPAAGADNHLLQKRAETTLQFSSATIKQGDATDAADEINGALAKLQVAGEHELRVAVSLQSLADLPPENLLEEESHLDRLLSDWQAVRIMCCYDSRRLNVNRLQAVLQVHSRILRVPTWCQSPLYLPLTHGDDDLVSACLERLQRQTESAQYIHLLHDMLINTAQPMAVVTDEGNVTMCNRAFCQLLGYSREQLCHMDWLEDLTPRKWQSQDQHVMDKLHETGKPQRFEKEYLHSDGSPIPVELLVHQLQQGCGDPRYYYVFATDISARKKIEDSLRQSRETAWTIFNNAHDAFFVHDARGRIIEVNDRMLDMFGVRRDEVSSYSLSDDFTAEDWDETNPGVLQHRWSRALEGEDQLFAWKARRPDDGETFDAEMYLTKMQLGGQTVLLTSARDVSDRKKAEAALEDTKRTIQRLHNVALQLGGVSDEEEVYRMTVEAAEEILEMSMCVLDVLEDNMLIPKAHSSDVSLDGARAMSLDEGIGGKTFREQKTFIIPNLQAEEDAEPVRSDYRSLISIPMGDIGIFQAISTEVNAFGCQDAELLEILIRHAAEAVKRIRTQRQLRRGREQFRTLVAEYEVIFEGTQDGIFLVEVTEEGRFVALRANSSLQQMMGADEDEIRGSSWEHLIGSELNLKIRDHFIRCLSTRRPVSLEIAPSQSGQTRHFHVRISPIISNDRVEHLVGSVRETTEQKSMQRALQESEEKYRVLAERANDLIVIIQDGELTYLNNAVSSMLGYDDAELLGEDWLVMIHPDDRDRVLKYHRRRMRGDEDVPPIYETALLHSDGRKVHVEVNASVITYEGEPANLTVLRDITERKSAEEKLRYLSIHDQLTGLYNRAYFDDTIERLDTPRQLPLTVVMGDVNGLKLVNDAFGHEMGDRLLQHTAYLLKGCCRSEDVLARVGGDEFAVVLPQTPASAAEDFIRRVRDRCRDETLDSINLSISLGASTKMDPDRDMRDVLKEAEDRMYRRKLLESESVHSALVSSLRRTLVTSETETAEHVERMRQMALQLGNKLDLGAEDLENLALLARHHDIGLVAIPEKLHEKDGSLTEEEAAELRRHPEIGYRIAQTSAELSPIARDILAHHEWFNGEGYPQGLQGEDIPLLARIIAVVDAYETMTRLQDDVTHAEALDRLRGRAGTQLDPDIVNLFAQLFPHGPPWEDESN